MRYEFELDKFDEELVYEYRTLLIKYGSKLNNPNAIGFKIAKGEMELTDDVMFQSAICFAKEYLEDFFKKAYLDEEE